MLLSDSESSQKSLSAFLSLEVLPLVSPLFSLSRQLPFIRGGIVRTDLCEPDQTAWPSRGVLILASSLGLPSQASRFALEYIRNALEAFVVCRIHTFEDSIIDRVGDDQSGKVGFLGLSNAIDPTECLSLARGR